MREAWTSGRELCCSQSHQQEFEAGVGETENRCLVSSPRVPMRPALPEASSQGRDGRWAAACSGETCSPGRETCSPGNLLSGVGRCEMTQAPHASLRGFLSTPWFPVRLCSRPLECQRLQSGTGGLAGPCHSYSSTSIPGAWQAHQRSLALGSECQHQTVDVCSLLGGQQVS